MSQSTDARWVECLWCEDFWCVFHHMHAWECSRPDIDSFAVMNINPYFDGAHIEIR